MATTATMIPLPTGTDRRPGPDCPDPVDRAGSVHRWDDLTFLHWAFEPEAVQRLLPAGLQVETFGGRAWVGLVPFRMSITAGDGPWPGRRSPAPVPPWIGRFPETNVRTYVHGPDGRTGVWFLSLDAARLAAVVVARGYFRMPYFWSAMAVSAGVSAEGRLVMDYRSRRRWPRPAAESRVVVEVGERLGPDDLGVFDHWLTARWSLYRTPAAGLQAEAMEAEHDPWPLHRARVLCLDDTLVSATGLGRPVGEPVVHWSPGVSVRVGPRGSA